MLDTTRIQSVLDIAALAQKMIVLVGVGGGSFLARQLARSGVKQFRLVDPQMVDPENICRQVYRQQDVGRPKVEATAEELKAIDPDIEVECFQRDVTRLSEDDQQAIFAGADLILALTDNHDAQSAANRFALKFNTALVSVGIYARAVGGEVFWARRDDRVRYCCMFRDRYENHERAQAEGRNLDPPSDGAPIFAGTVIDSIAGNVILGLLTEGADNMYGSLLNRLGDRQLLVMKMDPDWETRPGRDIVRDELGITPHNAFYFAYNTIAMAPSEAAKLGPCPECQEFRESSAMQTSSS